MATCRECSGKGSLKCPRCGGKGTRYEGDFLSGGKDKQCVNCSGSGRVKCGVCSGRGTV